MSGCRGPAPLTNIAHMSGEARASHDFRVLVGGIVVEHHVDVFPLEAGEISSMGLRRSNLNQTLVSLQDLILAILRANKN